jgi:uncharacterized protein
MKRIALISDNHSFLSEDTTQHLRDVDEIWHAGDIGDLSSIEEIKSLGHFIGVYGNIDTPETRMIYPENQIWHCEDAKIFMTHIGGYPGKYNARVKKIIQDEKPDIYICGHSHICKVMADKEHNLIHMNPGAYGHHGFHAIRTILKFNINGKKIEDLRAVELGRRGVLEDGSFFNEELNPEKGEK